VKLKVFIGYVLCQDKIQLIPLFLSSQTNKERGTERLRHRRNYVQYSKQKVLLRLLSWRDSTVL